MTHEPARRAGALARTLGEVERAVSRTARRLDRVGEESDPGGGHHRLGIQE